MNCRGVCMIRGGVDPYPLKDFPKTTHGINVLPGNWVKIIFYKVDMEKSNKTQICRILPYFFKQLGRAEFCKFVFYLIFPHQPFKKNGVYFPVLYD